MGLILSALFMMFRDLQYLWSLMTLLIMYLSAIFYTVDSFPTTVQRLFYINPLYTYITYVREVVVGAAVPDGTLHLLCIFYALAALCTGSLIYRAMRYKFIYYV